VATKTKAVSADAGGLSAPSSEAGKLQRAALTHLRDKDGRGEVPTSIRFPFYEAEQRGVVSRRPTRRDGTPSKRKPDQNLIDAVTHPRLGTVSS
jgi:hypothetical protein